MAQAILLEDVDSLGQRGEPIDVSPGYLRNYLVPRKLAQAAPLALEQIKRVSAAGDLDEGIEAEKRAFAEVFISEDAKEGIAAFLGKRAPHFQGR